MNKEQTVLERMEEMRQKAGAKEYSGHSYMDLARFDENTRHMVIFDVMTYSSPVGVKGERMRLFLSEEGYKKALDDEDKGHIRMVSHAKVAKGNLHYDHKEQTR